MIRLIDLPVVIVAIVLIIVLWWIGGAPGITGPMLTQFFNSVPNWLGLGVIILVGGAVIAASIYIWRKILARMGIGS